MVITTSYQKKTTPRNDKEYSTTKGINNTTKAEGNGLTENCWVKK